MLLLNTKHFTTMHLNAFCTRINRVTILSTSYILVRNVLTQYWKRVSAPVVFLHYLRRTNLWSRRQRKFSKKLVKLTGSDRALWAIREEIATFSEFYFLSRKVQASETTRRLGLYLLMREKEFDMKYLSWNSATVEAHFVLLVYGQG